MARKSRRNKNVEAVSNQIIENCENLIDTGAYIRLSVENGGNETDETLVVQQMLVEKFIEEHPDLKLAGTYIDNGFIDIGDGTVDLLVIRNGKPDLSVRVSDRSGMAVLRSGISNAIQQNYSIHLDSSDVEQVLMQEETILDEEIILEIQRMAENWLQRIINKLHTHVTDFRTNPAVFLGGGSLLLRKQIENSPEFKYVEFIDDVRANAIGYEKLTTARLRRG